MAASKKNAKSTKTAHVLNLLTAPGGEAETAPAVPAAAGEEGEAPAPVSRPLTPPILEVARANDEHLSGQILQALEEEFPEAEAPEEGPAAAEPAETVLSELAAVEPTEAVPAEPAGAAPEEAVPAESAGAAPEEAVPAEPAGAAPEETVPAEPAGAAPEETVPAEPAGASPAGAGEAEAEEPAGPEREDAAALEEEPMTENMMEEAAVQEMELPHGTEGDLPPEAMAAIEPEPLPAGERGYDLPVTMQENPEVLTHTADVDPNDEGLNYVNVMQILVEEKAPRYIQMFGLCPCRRCEMDVKALTLSNLVPKYVVMHKNEMVPMLTIYEGRYSSTIFAQLTRACKLVMDRPHHNRD